MQFLLCATSPRAKPNSLMSLLPIPIPKVFRFFRGRCRTLKYLILSGLAFVSSRMAVRVMRTRNA